MAPLPTTPNEDQIPDGVHIHLPESAYFRQKAIGSSDCGLLWDEHTADGYWWRSPHNPHYVRKERDALDFGSALHALVLEGPEAYESRYYVSPNPADYPGLVVTVNDLKSAISALPEAPGYKSTARKSDLIATLKAYQPERPIWDEIEDRARRQAAGRNLLSYESDYQIKTLYEAGLKDANINAMMTAEGGVRVTELSVFFTLPSGTRMRFRFDSLLPTVNCDLKSIEVWRQGESLIDAVGSRIGKGDLDIQAALSFQARRAMYQAIEEGRVWKWPVTPHGATDPEEIAHWLRRFPKEAPLNNQGEPGWRWLWAFFQKPTTDGRAPAILPVFMNFGSLKHRDGYRKAVHAVRNYEDRVRRYGVNDPWITSLPAHTFDENADPALQIQTPSWLKLPAPVSDEEDILNHA